MVRNTEQGLIKDGTRVFDKLAIGRCSICEMAHLVEPFTSLKSHRNQLQNHMKVLVGLETMRLPVYPPEKVSGLLLIVGSVQFLLGLVLAEELYPDYRVSQTISSLGRPGPSASVFNSSLFLEGTLVSVAAYFLHKAYRKFPVTAFFAVGGMGAMGSALFPEDVYNIHLAISIVSFFAAGLTPLVTLTLQSSPFNYLSISLAALSFCAASILAIPPVFYSLGLAYGAVERILAYSTSLWVIGFGGHIMGRRP